uniref:LysM domain-containing protein n=1 Tax=Macrostomum lignano TaxID=282301 RepID=A0A1I8H751_9PLAT
SPNHLQESPNHLQRVPITCSESQSPAASPNHLQRVPITCSDDQPLVTYGPHQVSAVGASYAEFPPVAVKLSWSTDGEPSLANQSCNNGFAASDYLLFEFDLANLIWGYVIGQDSPEIYVKTFHLAYGSLLESLQTYGASAPALLPGINSSDMINQTYSLPHGSIQARVLKLTPVDFVGNKSIKIEFIGLPAECPPIERYRLVEPIPVQINSTSVALSTAHSFQTVFLMELYHLTNLTLTGANCTQPQTMTVTFLDGAQQCCAQQPEDEAGTMYALNGTINAARFRVYFQNRDCENVTFKLHGCLADECPASSFYFNGQCYFAAKQPPQHRVLGQQLCAGIRWMDRGRLFLPRSFEDNIIVSMAALQFAGSLTSEFMVHLGLVRDGSGWAIEGSPSAKIKWSFWEPFQSQPEHTLALANLSRMSWWGSANSTISAHVICEVTAARRWNRSCDEPYFLPTLDRYYPTSSHEVAGSTPENVSLFEAGERGALTALSWPTATMSRQSGQQFVLTKKPERDFHAFSNEVLNSSVGVLVFCR